MNILRGIFAVLAFLPFVVFFVMLAEETVRNMIANYQRRGRI